jgi:CRP-like cAMP-binding protein
MPSTTKPSLALELLKTSKSARYAAGETIVTQGEHCREVHYIQDGIVKLTMVSKRGRMDVLGILGQADFFGEQW